METPLLGRIESWTGRLLRPADARAFSIIALAGALVACTVSLYFGFRGERFMGRPLGADFVQFYAAGQILNHTEASRIYDIDLMERLQHDNLPSMDPGQVLVFAYAPYIAQVFRPFALLTYKWAYCAWLVLSLMLYAGGLMLLFRNRLPGRYGGTALLLALSAPMYTLETWIGGQISVFGFSAAVLFVRCFERRRLFLAGMALGLAAYKPSLIAIPAAAMIAVACWRMIAGLCASTALMLAASWATAGATGLQKWLLALQLYGSLATAAGSALRRTKYVDLNSFFAILLSGNSVSRLMAAGAMLAGFLLLAWTCWRCRKAPLAGQRYVWAATFTWTLLVNIYVPVYDTILLVPAVALAAYSALEEGREVRAALQVWLMILWLAPWLTQSWADFLRLQILSIALAGFGWWTLTLARKACGVGGGTVPAPESELYVTASGRPSN